jgi:hypothetical protein
MQVQTQAMRHRQQKIFEAENSCLDILLLYTSSWGCRLLPTLSLQWGKENGSVPLAFSPCRRCLGLNGILC